MKICFVGLGTMGCPMVRRLADEGFEVRCWDVAKTAGASLPGRRASLEEAADGADIVWTMVPEGAQVAEIHNALRPLGDGPRRVFVDSSTIDVTATRDLGAAAIDAGHGFVDAPVSGGAEGARGGALSFMLGGAPDDIALIAPVLDALGTKVQHFGVVGSGQAAKACHNMICGITALGVCEAFALADALGLDQEKFFQLCAGAAAQSWILENRCPVPGPAPNAPASNGYAPGFAAALMAKDLRLAQAAAEAAGQTTPFGARAAQRFTEFAASPEDGVRDFSAIYKAIREP